MDQIYGNRTFPDLDGYTILEVETTLPGGGFTIPEVYGISGISDSNNEIVTCLTNTGGGDTNALSCCQVTLLLETDPDREK